MPPLSIINIYFLNFEMRYRNLIVLQVLNIFPLFIANFSYIFHFFKKAEALLKIKERSVFIF